MSDDFVEPVEEHPIIDWALRNDENGGVMLGRGREVDVPILDGWTRIEDVNAAARQEAERLGAAKAAGDLALEEAKRAGADAAADAIATQKQAIEELADTMGTTPELLAAALGQSYLYPPGPA